MDVTIEAVPGHEGVRRVVMPIDEGGSVNCWLLGQGNDLALIDTGLPGETTRQHWRNLFSGPLLGARIRAVLCTHGHPDHAGQADWLANLHGCPLFMTAPERGLSRLYLTGTDARVEARQKMLELAGFPADQFVARQSLAAIDPNHVEVEAQSVEDGDEIDLGGRPWRVMLGGGHSPAAISLVSLDQTLAIFGDQILPHMAPFVGVSALDLYANPVREYLTFLKRCSAIMPSTLALAGHAEPFLDVSKRASKLSATTRARCERVLAASFPGATCADLMNAMFRGPTIRENFLIRLSVAVATLNFLVGEGMLLRRMRSDSAWVFEMAPGRNPKSAFGGVLVEGG